MEKKLLFFNKKCINVRKKGFVYLIADYLNEGKYKIGVTRGDINKRAKKLQTGNPGDILMMSCYETDYPFYLEKRLHSRFSDKKYNGEWYDLEPNDINLFLEYCKKEDEIAISLKDNPFMKKYLK